jgi:glycogen debranching enzyme
VHAEDLSRAHRLLQGFVPHLDKTRIGSISEVFDAEPPCIPRGCIAQAWSVAEVLRAWSEPVAAPADGRRLMADG